MASPFSGNQGLITIPRAGISRERNCSIDKARSRPDDPSTAGFVANASNASRGMAHLACAAHKYRWGQPWMPEQFPQLAGVLLVLRDYRVTDCQDPVTFPPITAQER